jgi:hypothetical protein
MGSKQSLYDKKADDGRKACRHRNLNAPHIMAKTIRQQRQTQSWSANQQAQVHQPPGR